MGVKGLYTHLRPYRTDLYVHTMQALYPTPLRIGVDALSLLYKYKAAFKEILPLVLALKAQGHRVVFVFDGKASQEKQEEVAARREARTAAASQATGLREFVSTSSFQAMDAKAKELLEYSLARLEYQGWHVSREVRKEFQDLLKEAEVPFVKATTEADDVLVDLVSAGKLDVVISSDMDYLLAGAPRLWIPSRRGAAGFEEMVLEEVLRGEGVSREGLRDAGILCGVDELKGKVSVAPATAIGWIRHYGGTLEGVLARAEALPQLGAAAAAALDAETVARIRAHYEGQVPWDGRIRPEDLEPTRAFLEAL